MSFTMYGTEDIDFGMVGEDFELEALENAYRTGAMQRLTGIPAGAPSSSINFVPDNEVMRPVKAVVTTTPILSEDMESLYELGAQAARLPVDGAGLADDGDDDQDSGQNPEQGEGSVSKRSRDSTMDTEENSSFNKMARTSRDTNKSHTRKCREKVNDKFKMLLQELPLPPAGIELNHKAQILDYTIKTLKELANRKTSLETELALSSKKNLLRWVDNVISNAKTFPDAVEPFLDMFCTKKNWKYAELWLPAQQGEQNGAVSPAASVIQKGQQMSLKLRRWVLNRSLSSEEQGSLTKFAKESEHYTFNPFVGVPGRVFSTLRPEWLPQLDNRETFVRSALASEHELQVCLAVPVVIRGQVAAVTVFFDTEERDYEADCLDLAIDIASLTGNAYGAKGND